MYCLISGCRAQVRGALASARRPGEVKVLRFDGPGGLLLDGDHLQEDEAATPTLARLGRALIEHEEEPVLNIAHSVVYEPIRKNVVDYDEVLRLNDSGDVVEGRARARGALVKVLGHRCEDVREDVSALCAGWHIMGWNPASRPLCAQRTSSGSTEICVGQVVGEQHRVTGRRDPADHCRGLSERAHHVYVVVSHAAGA